MRVHLPSGARGAALLALALLPGPAAPARAQPALADGLSPDPRSGGLGAGTVVLPGLTYKILRSGPPSGARPLRSDNVTVRYEGRLTSGAVFSTSPDGGAGPMTFELQRLIPGWIAALQLMRPGDVWLVSVPPYLAYGDRGKEKIPPGSTLIFRIELISSAPRPQPSGTR